MDYTTMRGINMTTMALVVISCAAFLLGSALLVTNRHQEACVNPLSYPTTPQWGAYINPGWEDVFFSKLRFFPPLYL